ncbi:MAG: peptidase M22, partial [Oscillospiraceae bacterium]|nr:peptidase M22 [Oscillospiraceae bacterium]
MVLGIDTSNYSTSAALAGEEIKAETMLLPVKSGERGIRQSDAVFHHVRQLPLVIDRLRRQADGDITAIGVSVRPREAEGSYMPCFSVGENTADVMGSLFGVPVYKTSHQVGHILAALYSAGRMDLVGERFIAFHVSGGTTDSLLCEPSDDIMRVTQIGTSLDLYAGQLVDRVGVKMGLDFPCGIALEKLAAQSEGRPSAKPVMRGCDACMSGFENQADKLMEKGASHEDTAYFVLSAVCETVFSMTSAARKRYGDLPVVYAGGVMSDKLIRDRLSSAGGTFFAAPEFS